MEDVNQHSKQCNTEPIGINLDLVWDYEIPPTYEQSEAFHRCQQTLSII
ncbi:MAG: hypothetical protein R3A44_03825 [Caldilineaceae bacterium]